MSKLPTIKRKDIEVLQDIKNDLSMNDELDFKKRRIFGKNLHNKEDKDYKKALKCSKIPKFFEKDLECITHRLLENEQGKHNENQKWERPVLPPIDPINDDIYFQQIEIDDTMSVSGPTIRLYGVTEVKNSVLCIVTGFFPYFYVPSPHSFSEEHISSFKIALENTINSGNRVVNNIELVTRQSIYGFQGDEKSLFIKIIVNDPKYIARIRSSFERGDINFDNMFPPQYITFESNIPYVLRFMIDASITGMCWIRLPKTKYSIINEKTSNCQLEVSISWENLDSLQPEGNWQKIAPLRILSFDIECAGRKGIFPEPEIDPVIQIANTVTLYGEKIPFIRNVFTIDTCAQISGTQILSYVDQKELLLSWSKFVQKADPDVIIGYNIANFDIPYLIDRAKHLKINNFPYFGRIIRQKCEVSNASFSSKAYGTRESKSTDISGRLQLDMLQIMQRDYRLRSYTLNAVSAQFLNEQKEDVHHSIITDLQNGTSESRRRLAVYCLKDAHLPQRLMDKLMSLVNYIEMSRVTGVPFSYLLSRGQQIKIISQLSRKAREEGFIIPNIRSDGSDEQYEGATVIEPKKGYYNVPIVTLDFSSLYPSIMQAHNLCYTTLLNYKQIETLGFEKDKDYCVTPENYCFVKSHIRKGLLPQIFENLLAARQKVKIDLKNETDPFKKAVLDGRQLALKISANSVYGFTGATNGKLPCLPISSSVTSYGRQMIERAKEEIELKYTIENGYSHKAYVIYGDTDSVMINFGVKDISESMKLGYEAADYVTNKLIKPIKLEFEKVYFPYLLISKKRYAGLFWTKPETFDKIDSKGIETIRRDNCRLVSTVIETILRKLLIDQDVDGAQNYVKRVISDLLQNKIDMSNLVITKTLTKSDYISKQAHVELAERIRKRDSGLAPTLGDRVAYIIVKGAKGDQTFLRSEDPIYVLENNIPIDTKYYLDNQLSKPLLRIFEPILGEKANSLLSGDHTRTISMTSPAIGGLMKFTVKTATCIGCKIPLKNGYNGAVCNHCIGRTAELYQKQLNIVSDLEIHFAKLWTQCQRCQSSLHQDVLCTSKDCPIFYMRKKVQKDMKENIETLERFNESW
ncbi:DNA-directed DNA polymerase delta POL3 [Pneumocystis jirovecii RU7]|uniref:DNA polymerase n=1 Tax=Pneumocystis jirovecii (strain RU7) TaxID=1408657 RepID=A0A0W4ZP06_PNEJ7|nr:DNA-directed DNA polymerase delta POL3 [Pneumocystis jirovecii RU7]KTW30100.1 hypothetical protein T551_02044 [Pneumocystis jirovecii RU7]